MEVNDFTNNLLKKSLITFIRTKIQLSLQSKRNIMKEADKGKEEEKAKDFDDWLFEYIESHF
nr:hypothetical protein [uncultured Prevotella sp.]